MEKSNEKSKCCKKCKARQELLPRIGCTYCDCHKPSVEVSKCCGQSKEQKCWPNGICHYECMLCGKPFEPQSIPLDRDEGEEMYKCPSCGKESEHTVTWMKNANGIGGRCFECVQKDNNMSSCSPQKEKVCEKNCPDYSGMAILHKEQCECICHLPPQTESEEKNPYSPTTIASDAFEIRKEGKECNCGSNIYHTKDAHITPESTEMEECKNCKNSTSGFCPVCCTAKNNTGKLTFTQNSLPPKTESTEMEEWEKGFWKIMSEYPDDKKTILNQVRTIVERQVYLHSQKLVSEYEQKLKLMKITCESQGDQNLMAYKGGLITEIKKLDKFCSTCYDQSKKDIIHIIINS